MIRVIYTWEVDPDTATAFRETWRATTREIHRRVPGARGSFLLQSEEDPRRILTIARWDSRAQWEAFWRGENPQEMRGMRVLGRPLKVEVWAEFEDHTA